MASLNKNIWEIIGQFNLFQAPVSWSNAPLGTSPRILCRIRVRCGTQRILLCGRQARHRPFLRPYLHEPFSKTDFSDLTEQRGLFPGQLSSHTFPIYYHHSGNLKKLGKLRKN